MAPGTADLTADVDFSYLRRMAQGQVASLGPLQQHDFLRNMGIDVRLKVRPGCGLLSRVCGPILGFVAVSVGSGVRPWAVAGSSLLKSHTSTGGQIKTSRKGVSV